MHSYHHNMKTFNSATRHLTRVERSLYRDLIELYYDTEQALPAVDFDRLARRVLANTPEEKDALKYVLDEFFHKTGDVYTHDYCDEQIEKYHNQKTAKAIAGRASAEARKKKAEDRKKQRSNKNEQPFNECSSDGQQNATNQKPITNNQKPITNSKSKSARFKKPTLEELRAYCMEQGLSVDCEYFFNYYESNGWKVGRNAMKNWQLTLKNWHSRDSKKIKPISDKPVGNVNTAVDWATQ